MQRKRGKWDLALAVTCLYSIYMYKSPCFKGKLGLMYALMCIQYSTEFFSKCLKLLQSKHALKSSIKFLCLVTYKVHKRRETLCQIILFPPFDFRIHLYFCAWVNCNNVCVSPLQCYLFLIAPHRIKATQLPVHVCCSAPQLNFHY